MPHSLSPLRMTQPTEMKTKEYVYGVEKLDGFDAWELFVASAEGDTAKAKSLLDKDPRLVNAQFWYEFPIHMAVRGGHVEMVKLLLDRGADPGQSRFTYSSWNKLLPIAQERGYDAVARLLQRAMKRRFHYSPEFERLKEAIVARQSRQVSAVLRKHPELVRSSDVLGNNALHWSVITRQLDFIERFVELGTPLDAQRADGNTPLLLAVNRAMDYWYRGGRGRNHPSIRNTWVMVGDLLARGAQYVISVAAAVGDLERVDALLKKDPGLARRLDSARVSPLAYAAREGHTHIVQRFLEYGANPNLPEDGAPEGLALFEACSGNHQETAELLLEHGANPNAGADSSGCCLTICEVYHGKRAKPLQDLLRRHGAVKPPYILSVREMKQAVRKRDPVVNNGEFLDCVMEKGDLELLDLYLQIEHTHAENFEAYGCPKSVSIARRLITHGVDLNQPDWLGRTFLHACAERGDRSVAAIFLDEGANINAREIEYNGTPLATAIRSGPTIAGDGRVEGMERRRRMVEFLLKRGAATNLPDDPPWSTPLAWARARQLTDIEAILLKHGAR